ncbi:signal peptidase complex subunit 1 isoform X2 [Erinaceus europaeus]|uniref:Signal peptidase complex subunit 1 n=1 Tax=Erinaceus europaeus TaxID=9365 RepID=A0ABM3YHI6_ERIEU|nr:signal peptidase complex subunit 1 isoform X2 [Erinaceus europaeus]
MARGGGGAGPGQPATSASGVAAAAPPCCAGPSGCVRDLPPRPPPARSPLPLWPPPSALCRLPSASAMLEHLNSLPTQMDYKGQKLAEQMFQGIILVSALTLPPWPIYRRHPLKWLPVQDSATEDKKPGERKAKRHAKNN